VVGTDRNRALVPLVMDLFYVLPQGEPANIPAADPGCGF
jgi:hypothetical protein